MGVQEVFSIFIQKLAYEKGQDFLDIQDHAKSSSFQCTNSVSYIITMHNLESQKYLWIIERWNYLSRKKGKYVNLKYWFIY